VRAIAAVSAELTISRVENMKFGELTIAHVLLSAFSGIGVMIISWLVGKNIVGRFKNRDKRIQTIQKNNKVKGNMAGGNIVRTDSIHSVDTKRTSTKVAQSGNTVGGDMAGGNILKDKD
jgi:hypothetical protein